MIAAALAIALAGDPQRDSWIKANGKAISAIRASKERHAQERIFNQTLVDLKAQTSSRVRLDASGAKRIAESILANHRVFAFAQVQKAPPKTWWERLSGWVQDRWTAFFKALFGRVRVSANTSIAIGDILLGASVVAFLFLLLRLGLHYGRRGAVPALNALDVQAGADPALLCAQADEAANQGRYGTAVTYIFAAAVGVLRKRGALCADESETVGQLRRQVRTSEPAIGGAFDSLALALTLAVYADAALTQADWQRARAAYRILVAQAGRHAA